MGLQKATLPFPHKNRETIIFPVKLDFMEHQDNIPYYPNNYAAVLKKFWELSTIILNSYATPLTVNPDFIGYSWKNSETNTEYFLAREINPTLRYGEDLQETQLQISETFPDRQQSIIVHHVGYGIEETKPVNEKEPRYQKANYLQFSSTIVSQTREQKAAAQKLFEQHGHTQKNGLKVMVQKDIGPLGAEARIDILTDILTTELNLLIG